jgi:voltage-gated potassium channel
LTYAFGIYGFFDFLAVLPLFMALVGIPLSPDAHTIIGIMRFLKLARYSPALGILASAVIEERKPLTAALFIIALLAIAAATTMYFIERETNPLFATVPHSLWWAIVTLTTVGYGDVTPASPLGKMFNSIVAVLGLCMFALPASILATGFAEEVKRRTFMNTWNLVAKVPMFSSLHAGQIAEIAGLLRSQRVSSGTDVITEGEVGDSMYFIVSGQLVAKTAHGNFTLHPGSFFGEVALIKRSPRMATVTATQQCQLLVLPLLDFQNFVSKYPELLEVIRKTAQKRLKDS